MATAIQVSSACHQSAAESMYRQASQQLTTSVGVVDVEHQRLRCRSRALDAGAIWLPGYRRVPDGGARQIAAHAIDKWHADSAADFVQELVHGLADALQLLGRHRQVRTAMQQPSADVVPGEVILGLGVRMPGEPSHAESIRSR